MVNLRRPTGTDALFLGLAAGGVLIFVILAMGPAIVGHGTLVDTDWLWARMPWEADHVMPAGTMQCRGDTIDGVMPAVSNVVDAARSGRWQTWEPYEAGGAPLASLPTEGLLNPVSWPYWVMPLWLAPAFVSLSELTVVLVGMALFLGRLGVRRSSAVLAGLVFFTTGFMVVWNNWPHVKVAAFIPLLFWILDRAATTRRVHDIAILALVVASMLFGGFPAVTLYALTAGACYVVVRALRDGLHALTSALAISGAGVLLGVALSAVQILPFAEDLKTLLTGRAPRGPLPLEQFFTTFAFGIYGTCTGGRDGGATNPIEGIAYIGAAVFVLIACAVALRSKGPGVGVTVLLASMLLATFTLIWIGGWPLEALQRLPGFSSNHIGRASSIFGFLAATLAGIGLDRLFRHVSLPSDDEGVRLVHPAVLPVLATLAVGATYLGWLSYDLARRQGGTARFRAALHESFAVLLATLVAVLLIVLLRGRMRWIGAVLLVAALVFESTAFYRQLVPINSRASFYPRTAAHAYLQDELGGDRYAGPGPWGYQATSDYYRLRTPVGHAFTAARWRDLLKAVAPDTFLIPTFSQFPESLSTRDVGSNPLLDQLSVKYWATDPSTVVGKVGPWDATSDGSRLKLENGQRATCVLPGGGPLRGVAVRVKRIEPTVTGRLPRVHVKATSGVNTLTGVRSLKGRLAPGEFRVAVPAEALTPRTPVTVEVWFTGFDRPVVLASNDGNALCRPIRPRDDGLRLEYADAGSVIYRRLTSLPRVRWAGKSEVVSDGDQRLRRLEAGVGDDTVLLESERLPAAVGSTALVTVVADEPGRVVADVNATGSGYLVVADSIARPGWEATVDGRPADIVNANHAFGAVPVGAGSHRVALRYRAPGLRTGAYISSAAGPVTLLLLLGPIVRRRRRVGREAPSA